MLNTIKLAILHSLNIEEHCLFDADVYQRSCLTAIPQLTKEYRKFQCLIKPLEILCEFKMEKIFMRCLIKDIIISGQYTLFGIAQELRLPLDLIEDLAMGINTDPSWLVAKNLINLHREARPELYESIYKKCNLEAPNSIDS